MIITVKLMHGYKNKFDRRRARPVSVDIDVSLWYTERQIFQIAEKYAHVNGLYFYPTACEFTRPAYTSYGRDYPAVSFRVSHVYDPKSRYITEVI